MERLSSVQSREDIFPQYRDTPIGLLLEYHNLERPFDPYTHASLLIGMCMDNRKHLGIPDNFAFILRAGGANLRPAEFKVSYAIAVGGVRAIALIGHTQCGMVNLMGRENSFIEGLVEGAGWERTAAEEGAAYGAARYAAWKIERHTGLAVPLTPWRERHVILASPGVFWRLWKARRKA